MKVYYETEFRPGYWQELRYNHIANEFCCKEMETAWSEAVIFGDFDNGGTCKDVSIGCCRPYPEGAVWDSFPIKFCPFCGEAIVTIERTRKTFKKTVVSKKVKEEVWKEIP